MMKSIPTAGSVRVAAGKHPHHVSIVSAFAVLLLLCLAIPRVQAIPLLPGVYGYGVDRGTNEAGFKPGFKVLKVTNMTDDVDGSGNPLTGTLREVLGRTLSPSTAPRVIVFEKSGAIMLRKELKIAKDHVTIAGQSAPAPGVALHGAPLVVTSNNVLVQHLRIRPGDGFHPDKDENVTYKRDAASIGDSVDGAQNVVFDHCTFGWSLDECVEGYYAYDNVAFNRCIFGEPLYLATHLDEATLEDNRMRQAEDETFTPSSSSVTESTEESDDAVEGSYHELNFTANGQYMDYSVTVIAGNPRPERHILVTGVTGPDRGKFRVKLYRGSQLIRTSPDFDLYDDSEKVVTIVDRGDGEEDDGAFELPDLDDDTTFTFRIESRGTGAEGGRKIGIDQLSITEPHGMGPLFRDGNTHFTNQTNVLLDGKLSIIGSIFAHMQARGPWVGSADLMLANNVFYNRRQQFVMLGTGTGGTYVPMNAAIVGNTFIEGRNLGGLDRSPIDRITVPSGSLIYVPNGSNDYLPGVVTGETAPDLYDGTTHSSDTTSDDDGMAGFTPASAATAYANALFNAGAWPGYRDEMESRIIGDIAVSAPISDRKMRQGALKNTVEEAGGWPDYSVTTLSFNENDSTWDDIQSSGYTKLEEYLQDRADFAEAPPSQPTISGSLQAESASRTGSPVPTIETIHAGYAGTGFVNFPASGGVLSFTHTWSNPGTRVLRFRYAFDSATTRTGNLAMNGGSPQSITFSPSGSFTSWAYQDAIVSVVSGSNTIALSSTGQDLGNIDEMAIYVPTILQAESATLGGGALVDSSSNATGFHGTGVVNFMTGSESSPSYVTFSGVSYAPGKMIQIRYALGGSNASRTGELEVNGVAQLITFPNTGAFTTYRTMAVPVTLNSGSSNTITLRAIGQDLANVDEILVY